MYAQGYAAERRLRPGGLALAIGINGALVLAIATAAPDLVTRIIDKPIETYPVPIPPDPQPLPPDPPVRQQHAQPVDQKIDTVDRIIDTATDKGVTVDPGPPLTPGSDTGTGTGTVTADPPLPPPVLIEASNDPRYAGDLQPVYPPSEQRAGREGRVVVRVLIGTDGRVKAVEPVSATSDAFFETTRRQAIGKWRFRPATRDGVPVESWKRIGVSFSLNRD